MTGSYIDLRDMGHDFRDYLDGVPIHNGEQLQLLVGEQWIHTRYELADFKRREVGLIGVDCVWKLNRATMLFRWPSRE